MTGAHLWIPAFAGMTKKGQSHAAMGSRHSRKTLPIILAKRSSSFPQNTPRHSRKTLPVIPAKHSPSFPQNTPRHSRKTLPVIPAKHSSSFPQNTPRHSREGGNPLGITVIHTGVFFLNQPNLSCLSPFLQAHLCRVFRWVCWL